MKKLLPLGILAALGFGAYKWAGSMVDAAEGLTYEPRGVRFGPQKRIIIKLAIVNTAPVALFFDKVHLTALWNTSALGAVDLNERVIVPANGEVVKEFPFQIQLTGIVLAIIQAFKDNKLGTISTTGYVSAAGIKIPIDYTTKLTK